MTYIVMTSLGACVILWATICLILVDPSDPESCDTKIMLCCVAAIVGFIMIVSGYYFIQANGT